MIICKYDPKEHARMLYNMELHESISFSSEICVTRVPGGWIYDRTLNSYKTDGTIVASFLSSVVVPYNDEFKEHEDLRNIPVCEKIDNCEGAIHKK